MLWCELLACTNGSSMISLALAKAASTSPNAHSCAGLPMGMRSPALAKSSRVHFSSWNLTPAAPTLPSVRASGASGCRLASGSTLKGSGS